MPQLRNRRAFWCSIIIVFLPAMTGCDPKSVIQTVGANHVKNSSDDEVREMFEQANAACPRRMDPFTMLREIEMIDDANIEFRYTVDRQGEKLLAGVDPTALKKSAVEMMKGNPMAVAIAERNLTIHHLYDNETGSQVLAYTVNKETLAGNFEPVGAQQQNPFSPGPVSQPATSPVVGTPVGAPATASPASASPRPQRSPAGVQTNPFL